MRKRIVSMLAALVLMLGLALPVSAAEGNVTYQGDSGKFVFAPGSSYSLTDLFPNFKDVMPGDTLTQHITLRGKPSFMHAADIYMRAVGAHENSKEFLSQLKLTVKKNGKETAIFDAPASQPSSPYEWVYLGTIYSSGKVDLEATLEVPVTLDSKYMNQVGYLDWEFMAEEHRIYLDSPKTGDIILRYAAIMALSGTAIVILAVLYKKRKKSEE